MFGSHKPFIVPGEIKVKVGKAMYIKDYLSYGFAKTVMDFKLAMERQVKTMLYKLINNSG